MITMTNIEIAAEIIVRMQTIGYELKKPREYPDREFNLQRSLLNNYSTTVVSVIGNKKR